MFRSPLLLMFSERIHMTPSENLVESHFLGSQSSSQRRRKPRYRSYDAEIVLGKDLYRVEPCLGGIPVLSAWLRYQRWLFSGTCS